MRMRSVVLSTLLLLGGAGTLSAQSGNGSDVSGPNVTGSSIAGGAFVPTPLSPVSTPIPAPTSVPDVPAVSLPIPAALVPTVTALVGGTAAPPSAPGGPASTPIPAETGILLVQLAASAPGSAVTVAAGSALLAQLTGGTAAPGVDVATNLLGSMSGVLAAPTPANIAAAVGAYNALVADAPAGFLSNPPPAFQAILLLLGNLVATAPK
jgi:hypothetical protein